MRTLARFTPSTRSGCTPSFLCTAWATAAASCAVHDARPAVALADAMAEAVVAFSSRWIQSCCSTTLSLWRIASDPWSTLESV